MNKRYINNTLDTERRTLHLSDDEKRFAIIDTLTVSGGQTITPVVTIRYQYDNHLGSACLELDQNAAIISYEEYHPFGTTSYRSGRTETEVSLKRYKYCGKERDEEIGLYYYGMRYYAAWICRFVSVDPLQFKYPELTPFQYASNRPITMIDLDGEEAGQNRLNDRGKWSEKKEARRIKVYQGAKEKFEKNIVLPLKKMLDEDVDPKDIQAAADVLAIKYQEKKWFRVYTKVEESSSHTGNKWTPTIGISAFREGVIDKFTSVNKSRESDEKIYTSSTGLFVKAGQTLKIKFDPFAVEDKLKIKTIDSQMKENIILKTEFIKHDENINETVDLEIKITSENEGEIYFTVEHSEKKVTDNWELNIEVIPIPVFDPKPVIDERKTVNIKNKN